MLQAENERVSAIHKALKAQRDAIASLIDTYEADPCVKNRSGKTALHVATQSGNWTIAKYLMQRPEVDKKDRDYFGNTPLIYAILHRSESEDRKDVIERFSPWRSVAALTADAKLAAKGYEAMIMDFKAPARRPKVERRAVYDLLYATLDQDSDQPLMTVSHPKSTSFRWIRLPTNNATWCLDLLTKDFIEKGAVDIHAFTALQKSFDHQHRGVEPHSKYMTPICQSFMRSRSTVDSDPSVQFSSLKRSSTFKHESDLFKMQTCSQRYPNVQQDSYRQVPRSGSMPVDGVGNVPKGRGPRGEGRDLSDMGPQLSWDVNDPRPATIGGMYLFTPFLHFETVTDRQEMQDLANQVHRGRFYSGTHPGAALFRAYLEAPCYPLHMRQTLDQFFYRYIDTAARDRDQVIQRYQQKVHRLDSVKLLMVDQLWMWVLHDNLIVTSFPQPWSNEGLEEEYGFNMWEDISESIRSSNRGPPNDVYELAMTITGRCFSAFDRYRFGSYNLHLSDIFEASIGDAVEEEVKLFETFNRSTADAFAWLSAGSNLRDARQANRGNDWETPDCVENLFDVRAETKLLKTIKDIIDELDMLTMIFDSQEKLVVPHLKDAVREIGEQQGWLDPMKKRIDKSFEDNKRIIAHPGQDVQRMKRLAARIERSIKGLLDLKQKQVNIMEARASRTQVENTASQGNILMVFTTFSVVFLPLSFIASFFTINISQLPQGSNGNLLSVDFVAKYMFGVGIPIALACLLVARSFDNTWRARLLMWFWERWLLMKWLVEKWKRSSSRSKINPTERALVQILVEAASLPQRMANPQPHPVDHSELEKGPRPLLTAYQPSASTMRSRVAGNGHLPM